MKPAREGRLHAAWRMLFVAVLGAATPASGTSVEHGRELFALAAGCGCHTPAGGPVGAGGVEIETPFGKFYSTNITSDPDTGIGAWSDEEIDAAIRHGRVRGKGAESPVMPYPLYAGMSDADARDLITYLRTLAPVRRENRPHDDALPLARWAYRAWQWLFFWPATPPVVAPETGIERGRYLTDHVALCTDCHTPRNALGALDVSMYLAGTVEGPGGEPVPNITPHATGIGDWDAADVVHLLRTTMLPNFDNVQGAMAEAVEGIGDGAGYEDAPESDLRAIADYVIGVKPIDNKVDEQ